MDNNLASMNIMKVVLDRTGAYFVIDVTNIYPVWTFTFVMFTWPCCGHVANRRLRSLKVAKVPSSRINRQKEIWTQSRNQFEHRSLYKMTQFEIRKPRESKNIFVNDFSPRKFCFLFYFDDPGSYYTFWKNMTLIIGVILLEINSRQIPTPGQPCFSLRFNFFFRNSRLRLWIFQTIFQHARIEYMEVFFE